MCQQMSGCTAARDTPSGRAFVQSWSAQAVWVAGPGVNPLLCCYSLAVSRCVSTRKLSPCTAGCSSRPSSRSMPSVTVVCCQLLHPTHSRLRALEARPGDGLGWAVALSLRVMASTWDRADAQLVSSLPAVVDLLRAPSGGSGPALSRTARHHPPPQPLPVGLPLSPAGVTRSREHPFHTGL